MTLTEIEEMARRELSAPEVEGAPHPLAEVVLALLPVVRAAEAWADTNAESDTAETYQLVDAIISMRRKLGGS